MTLRIIDVLPCRPQTSLGNIMNLPFYVDCVTKILSCSFPCELHYYYYYILRNSWITNLSVRDLPGIKKNVNRSTENNVEII